MDYFGHILNRFNQAFLVYCLFLKYTDKYTKNDAILPAYFLNLLSELLSFFYDKMRIHQYVITMATMQFIMLHLAGIG